MTDNTITRNAKQLDALADKIEEAQRTGCSCHDPTADSPDPVVVRLEAELECERVRRISAEANHAALLKANERLEVEVEQWKLNVADQQGRIRELHADNTRLRGLLREACEMPKRIGSDWQSTITGDKWTRRVTTALEEKP